MTAAAESQCSTKAESFIKGIKNSDRTLPNEHV